MHLVSRMHVCRLKEHLRQKLIDSGWRNNLKEYTMRALPARPSLSRPLAASCQPHGDAAAP